MADGQNRATRVFVVEDEALLRLMLGEMITELGHEIVAEAYKLDAAIKLATEADYDLAVLDLNLGDGITYDVADVVLQRGKGLVLSTGYGRTGLNPKYESCVVLQKPFTQDAVGRAIQLSHSSSARPDRKSAAISA